MAASPRNDPAPSATAGLGQMSPIQKIATLLVILEPDVASQLLKNFEEQEIENICAEMAKITLVSQQVQAAILQEFSGLVVQAGTALRGGVERTQSVLEKSIGLFKASNIISRVAPARAPNAVMDQILEAEPRQIFNVVRGEQVQTIAFVVSHLPPEKASQVLCLLPAETRDQVVERLATLAPTPLEVAEKVVAVLNTHSSGHQPRALSTTGGLKSAAALLNALDKTVSKTVLLALQERNPDLAQSIQQKMFGFEDLVNLETSALQRILREIDLQDLTVALKSASDKLKSKLLGSISKRAAETVNEELSMMGSVKLKVIETAQNRIIEVVRRLETEGEIDLGNAEETPHAAAA